MYQRHRDHHHVHVLICLMRLKLQGFLHALNVYYKHKHKVKENKYFTPPHVCKLLPTYVKALSLSTGISALGLVVKLPDQSIP